MNKNIYLFLLISALQTICIGQTDSVNIASVNKDNAVRPAAYPGGMDSLQSYLNQEMKDALMINKALIELNMNVDEKGKVSKQHVTRVSADQDLNHNIYLAFARIHQLTPESFNGIARKSKVSFVVFINPDEEIIVDYAPDSGEFMKDGEVACYVALKKSELGNANAIMNLYSFGASSGFTQARYHYALAWAYYNKSDTVKAINRWTQAASLGDSDAYQCLRKYGSKALNDSTVVQNENQKATPQIFSIVEEMPKFPDGAEAGFMNFIQKNLEYPEWEKKNKIQGTAFAQFVVRPDGSVTDVSIIKGIPNGSGLEKEIIRVIQSSPKWIPGTQNGNKVSVYYRVPVRCTPH